MISSQETANPSAEELKATVQLNDSSVQLPLIERLPIEPTDLSDAYKRIALYTSLLSEQNTPATQPLDKKKRNLLLMRYMDLRLLNQQVRQADLFISHRSSGTGGQKQRIFAIDPHIMATYADCFDGAKFAGFSILKQFSLSSSNSDYNTEEQLALLALMNDSIVNDKVDFLLLDQGLNELSTHVNFFTSEDVAGDKTAWQRLKKSVRKLITSGLVAQPIDNIDLTELLDQLEGDTAVRIAYSVFPAIIKQSAVERMRKLLRLHDGHFHALEYHPTIKNLNNGQKKKLRDRLKVVKDSRCYFEVQRDFRQLYRKFVSEIHVDAKLSAREYDNVDALFEIHCINIVLQDVAPDITVSYVCFSPKVTAFANLFQAGAVEVSVIHPRFLPIYLGSNLDSNKDIALDQVNLNINAILSASRFTKEDLLEYDKDQNRYLLAEDKLDLCYEKVQQPLAAIENLYNVTSGRDDLTALCKTIVKELKLGDVTDEFKGVTKDAQYSSIDLQNRLHQSFEKLVEKWQNQAVSVSQQFKDDLIGKIVKRQLDTLKDEKIHFAPVIVRKVEKNDDFKYVVFLPTLGSARYAFAIPFLDGDEWIKAIKLEPTDERAQLFSIKDVVDIFSEFADRAESKRLKNIGNSRTEIAQRLVSGILCIATYHWSLAKTLFAEGKAKALEALEALKEPDERENARICLLLQECQFFYQIAERGNIEHHYSGNMHAKQLIGSYQTIRETTQRFNDFHRDIWSFDKGTHRVVHPMSARHTISCIMLILELLSSKKAIEIVMANKEKYASMSLFGVDCIKNGGTLLSDKLMALSLTEAISSPATTLELCREECIHAYNLLDTEYQSIDENQVKHPQHSRILLTNRKMRFLQVAVTIDFIQQFGFYESLHCDQKGSEVLSYRDLQGIDNTWGHRYDVFNRFLMEYNNIKNYIRAKNAELDVTHRLSEILCLLGFILYEPAKEVKSFKRLLMNDFAVDSNVKKSGPFPTNFLSELLSNLDQVDSLCRRMPSSGFPRTFAREMKIIVATKAEIFTRLVANGIKEKYLSPYER